ncbi:MAG: response regulator [Geminocystis sp.]|nr:response regulator [Geminocystis sp.]MCS7147094.1 response regulator [Geminocystis sp.]MDW8116730.1 response regulator [Geminocystis sp.]MDW8463459.1 response regulator [Geminocystis sp.]
MDVNAEKILPTLREKLAQLYDDKATGELTIRGEYALKTFYLLSGRLQYVTDSVHRVRRWLRALSQFVPHWNYPKKVLTCQPWEYDLLYQGVSGKAITLEDAKQIIASVLRECLLEISLEDQIELQWHPTERVKSTFSYFLSLVPTDTHSVFEELEAIRDNWIRGGLTLIRPSLAPVLLEKGKSLVKNPLQLKYLSGEYTIWDIALKSKQRVDNTVSSLLNWQEKGLIVFNPVADLTIEIEDYTNRSEDSSATAAAAKQTVKEEKKPVLLPEEKEEYVEVTIQSPSVSKRGDEPLIACIDDSPIVVHNLKKVLQRAGFDVLAINEPMAGFAKLIEHKPDLILLDLNMPNANGYSVCKFLRESPVFHKTPIIILTAQDSSVDRAKAKLVGATDFLNKSASEEELLSLIERYLPAKVQKNQMITG